MFKRFWWVFLVMLPVGAMAGLMVMAVVSYVMPKKYESEAIIEVRPIASPSNEVPHTKPQYFYATEFNKIKSRASLAKVVEKLELTNTWGMDQEAAIRVLKEIVSTENIRGTDLIAIRVRHTDREAARDIAAELARSYRDYRIELVHRDRDRGLVELKKSVRGQEDKVEERRKILSDIDISRKKNVTVDDTETLLHLPDSQDYIDAKREFETDQALLQSMMLQQIRATVAAEMPGESVVIHEEPQIGNAPASPHVPLNLLLGAVGGVLLSPLLALPLIWLLDRLNPARSAGPPVLP